MAIPSSLQEKLKKYEGRLPLPVISLANDSGIEVYDTGDLRDKQSGLIKKEGDGYVIYVNERHPSTRKLFTIAHEIAHFHLHKNLLDSGQEHIDSTHQPVGNGHAVLNRTDGVALTTEEAQIEKDANQLAAEILMPEEEFKKIFQASSSIEEVAEKFGVSSAAAAVRAKNLLGEVIF